MPAELRQAAGSSDGDSTGSPHGSEGDDDATPDGPQTDRDQPGTTATGGSTGTVGDSGLSGYNWGNEICNNGVDDDDDSIIDEGCECASGDVQRCWPGAMNRRGQGECTDGTQACVQAGGFWTWGPCRGAVLPDVETGGNGIDEDCDGQDSPYRTCLEAERGTLCGNGVDDDCDNNFDCADSECGTYCDNCTDREDDCSGGYDDDCDGQTDCADSDCYGAAECTSGGDGGCVAEFPFVLEIACNDGRDNDCDGLTDCDDFECQGTHACGCEERETAANCHDRVDNDCDGFTDCGDDDCEICVPGTFRYCDEPTFCFWGRQECSSGGAWGACIETSTPPVGCRGDLYDAGCCVSSGACCQNYPRDQSSIGSCPGVTMCQ